MATSSPITNVASDPSSSMHGLKAFHDHDARIHITLSTVGKASRFAGAEPAPRRASNALVPARTCKLCHHLIDHCSFLFLVKESLQFRRIKR
uniref:Mitochondrial import inner membrane translocase subunit Tim8/small zinc finger-like protein n=1 Tax=Rhizophora mucronata TaxID=61149 RepID=A0A2P2K388_RHIMU